jgi:hypothetical protein
MHLAEKPLLNLNNLSAASGIQNAWAPDTGVVTAEYRITRAAVP